MPKAKSTLDAARPHYAVAVIGAGFAGLGTPRQLERLGIDYVMFERAPDVGGTWWANSYPGARCDVPSHLYSFSFAPNPTWTHTYSSQQEILDYLRRYADESGIRTKIKFRTEVRSAEWDEAGQRWQIETSRGVVTAGVVVGANGPLSEPAIPHIPGLDTFNGTVFHSAAWNHEHDLAGERVAVIGTGASAIQFVPAIQPTVGRLHLFQRTPPWVLPHRDREITAFERRLYALVPPLQQLVRAGVYSSRELVILGMAKDPRLMRPVARIARRHLARQVPDRELRRKLEPTYTPGCKRLLLSNDYYPAVASPNVELVTEGIAEVGDDSIVTTAGRRIAVDTIILGTGFEVTHPAFAHRVRGAGGTLLADAWADHGLQAHHGTSVPGFPNMFLLAGPNTGIGHTSLVVMIEAQIRYVAEALRTMRENELGRLEVRREPFLAYNQSVQERVRPSVWNTGGCASWYLDSEGRNTTLWPDFTWRFVQATRRFDLASYTAEPVRRPEEERQLISA